jgi:hypothetical protein
MAVNKNVCVARSCFDCPHLALSDLTVDSTVLSQHRGTDAHANLKAKSHGIVLLAVADHWDVRLAACCCQLGTMKP